LEARAEFAVPGNTKAYALDLGQVSPIESATCCQNRHFLSNGRCAADQLSNSAIKGNPSPMILHFMTSPKLHHAFYALMGFFAPPHEQGNISRHNDK